MAEAFGRRIGTEEWRPITLIGRQYKHSRGVLEGLVERMRTRFPENAYKVVDDEESNDSPT